MWILKKTDLKVKPADFEVFYPFYKETIDMLKIYKNEYFITSSDTHSRTISIYVMLHVN